MPETTALGAAMAAGAADGVSVWSLKPEDLTHGTTDTFRPQIGDDGTEPYHPCQSTPHHAIPYTSIPDGLEVYVSVCTSETA